MQHSITVNTNQVTLRWYRAAVVYLVIAVTMGAVMGAQENFLLRTVHSHLNLVGWVTLALMGLIYQQWPQLGSNRLATVQFWLHNAGLAIMAGGLTALLSGYPAAKVLVAIGSTVVAIAVGIFAINMTRGARAATADSIA